VESRGV